MAVLADFSLDLRVVEVGLGLEFGMGADHLRDARSRRDLVQARPLDVPLQGDAVLHPVQHARDRDQVPVLHRSPLGGRLGEVQGANFAARVGSDALELHLLRVGLGQHAAGEADHFGGGRACLDLVDCRLSDASRDGHLGPDVRNEDDVSRFQAQVSGVGSLQEEVVEIEGRDRLAAAPDLDLAETSVLGDPARHLQQRGHGAQRIDRVRAGARHAAREVDGLRAELAESDAHLSALAPAHHGLELLQGHPGNRDQATTRQEDLAATVDDGPQLLGGQGRVEDQLVAGAQRIVAGNARVAHDVAARQLTFEGIVAELPERDVAQAGSRGEETLHRRKAGIGSRFDQRRGARLVGRIERSVSVTPQARIAERARRLPQGAFDPP
ncbi:hypothetical protein D3C86_976500 [compost metagenome]